MTEAPPASATALLPREREVARLAMGLQFALVLDFVLPLPLGPDLVEPLGLQASALGWLAAAYTGAAAFSGLVFAPWLDRFDRARALAVVLLGLGCASGLGALAINPWTYIATRALSGLFAAPAFALLMAWVTDEVDDSRRGRAMAWMLSGNALAGVVGVPACLWLAEVSGWRAGVAVVTAVVCLTALGLGRRVRARPPAAPRSSTPARNSESSTSTTEGLAHLLIFVTFAATVAMTANLSAFVQLNLGLPRSAIPPIYMLGGLAALVSMRVCGPAVDRWGALSVGGVAIVGLATLVGLFAARVEPLIGPELAFVLLLGLIGARNVSIRALTSRVPGPGARARFMSLQTTAQQLGAVAGSLLGTFVLSDDSSGALVGMPILARCSIVGLLAVPVLLYLLQTRVDRAQDETASSHAPS